MHFAHGVQQFVGLQAAAVTQQQFQHLAADGREAASALLAQRLGDAELGADGVAAGGTGRSGHGGLYLNERRARRARDARKVAENSDMRAPPARFKSV
ncbi:hypothetical protein D3C77_579120 [compost metagenome]